MVVNNVEDLQKGVEQGEYAWPGGYPVHPIMSDGEILCWDCFRNEYEIICESVKDRSRDGWSVAGFEAIWEGTHECAHCNKEIESAYGEWAE